MSIYGAIALNRFGLGARPGEIPQISGDPRGWLTSQITRQPHLPQELGGLPSSSQMAALSKNARLEKKQMLLAGASNEEIRKSEDAAERHGYLQRELSGKLQACMATQSPFYERLVSFWANHFSISGLKGTVYLLAGAYEREAIRPHVFGRFSELVRAADLHPAMLYYLDNQQSVGPNSTAVERRERRLARNPDKNRKGSSGLNENLAREIMELHTLGVNGGYSQADVTNFAKVLTGWTIAKEDTGAVFMPERHEPGPQTIMGAHFPDTGENQAPTVLDALARAPATATHIATKLVRHFVADDPPASAVEQIAHVFRQTEGDLAQVSTALVNLNEAWQQPLAKFKRPDEYLISIGRALNMPQLADKAAGALKRMGFELYRAPSPQGWPDTAADWAGTDAIWKRIEYANLIAAKLGQQQVDARALADAILGETQGPKTKFAINGAETPMQAVALLFCSPEFMRR